MYGRFLSFVVRSGRFDILRTSSGPFVCDVNGFSFVKGNVKYYEDCANILRLFFIKKSIERWTAFGIPTHLHTALPPTGPCSATKCESTHAAADSLGCSSRGVASRDSRPGGAAVPLVASPQAMLQQLLHARNAYRAEQDHSQCTGDLTDPLSLACPAVSRATTLSPPPVPATEGRLLPSDTEREKAKEKGDGQESPTTDYGSSSAGTTPSRSAEETGRPTGSNVHEQRRQRGQPGYEGCLLPPGGLARSKADWCHPFPHDIGKDDSSCTHSVHSLSSSSGAESCPESGLFKIRGERSGFGERVSGQQAASQGGSFSPYTTAGEGSGDEDEELRTVVVVMRHGDRKPKQKLKFQTEQELILELFDGRNPRKEVKLKSPEELKDLLERNTEIITSMVRADASAALPQRALCGGAGSRFPMSRQCCHAC